MKVTAKTARYIKLGKGGRYETVAFGRSELHFGFGQVPHATALSLDVEQIKNCQIAAGRNSKAATDDAREIVDFYRLGSDCLWITFASGYMWWTFAEPKVTWLGGDGKHAGQRIRKSIGGWRNIDSKGGLLKLDSLSTKLTKVTSYQRTICAVDKDYALRRINGIVEPVVMKSNRAQKLLLGTLGEAIRLLHWRDLETLTDIIFARSGWHRITKLGGTQKLIDLALEQPTTNERCAIQIKSSASQRNLIEFVRLADETDDFDRLFFVCHSPKQDLKPPTGRDDVHIWSAAELSKTTLRLGLADWVIEKVS